MTCGDVGLEKAVIVSKTFFPLVLSKLGEFTATRSYKSSWLSAWGATRAIQGFLSRRCSKEFLALYLAQYPELLDRVSEPGLYLDTVTEVRLAARLNEFDLLPDVNRKRFVETVSNYALTGEDADALGNATIQSLFHDDELDELRERVRVELIPRLSDVQKEWEANYSRDDAPDGHMQRLLESFATLEQCFSDDVLVISTIEQETQRTNDWVHENTQDEPEISPRELGNAESPDKPSSARSLFDDIDEGEHAEVE